MSTTTRSTGWSPSSSTAPVGQPPPRHWRRRQPGADAGLRQRRAQVWVDNRAPTQRLDSEQDEGDHAAEDDQYQTRDFHRCLASVGALLRPGGDDVPRQPAHVAVGLLPDLEIAARALQDMQLLARPDDVARRLVAAGVAPQREAGVPGGDQGARLPRRDLAGVLDDLELGHPPEGWRTRTAGTGEAGR